MIDYLASQSFPPLYLMTIVTVLTVAMFIYGINNPKDKIDA